MIEFTYRGLSISADVDEYDPGDYWNPPSGGGCDGINWEVDDLDEVLAYLGIESEEMIRACFRNTGKLPSGVVDQINREWNLDEAANEFLEDAGGIEEYYFNG